LGTALCAIALAVCHEQAKGRIYHVADAEVLSEAERITRVGAHVGTSVLDQFYDEVDPDALKATGYKPPEASQFEQFRDEPDMYNPAALSKDPSGSEALAMELLFHDCEPDVARWAISKQRNQQSMAHIFEVTPLQAFPDVEYTYIACTDDRTISPVWSRYAARKRLGVDAIELPGGHCPYLSRPTQLASVLSAQ